ncbi:hypothetical protein PAXINDRAFT_172429 [Paxillus involutus ATCC 200175]|uniref:DUF6534 domain-containing protein n=1 Tax=Paxillus involutus ATCC 200175 TaxID=664439 RepID=A0A0C9TPE8_PAXIN|nr:hypothetical protein PAXINDRAFT_172429 [Paxillus involutus ATCC 200175]
MAVDVPATYGALLVGGFVAAALAGIVTVQSFIYVKLYPHDVLQTKAIVGAVWLLDTAHTALVCASIWIYLIENFGDTAKIDMIPGTLAMTVALTAILTFVVHCFFAQRIHKLSRRNWRITGPLMAFAFLRLCSASVTTAEMIHMRTFSSFKAKFRWIFTLGLALSCFVDIMIAGFLCYSLRSNRKASSSMDRVINSVILYTFENNSLTSAATVVSMICWLTMPSNLVFMGLHFVIGKLYANSLLATLNARRRLQNERAQRGLSAELPVAFPGYASRFRTNQSSRSEPPAATKVEINVEKTVEYEVDASQCGSPTTPGTYVGSTEVV